MVPLFLTFHWMWEDERWRYKWLFQSLIFLIPVVGQISLLGWMLTMCDSLVAGNQTVPPAGFYLRRGIKPLLIGVFYWVGLAVPLALLGYYDTLSRGALQLARVATVYNDLALLLYLILIVPFLIATDRGGLLGGLNFVLVGVSILRRPLRTLVAALVFLIALAICFLGIALIILAPFAITYAASVVATIAAWWYRPRQAAEQPEYGDGPSPTGPHVPFRPPGVEPDSG
jgi:hypothetical protein